MVYKKGSIAEIDAMRAGVTATGTVLRPLAEVHSFPQQSAYLRGVKEFHEGKIWNNPFPKFTNKAKEWQRGQNYAYFYTLRIQKSIEKSIREKVLRLKGVA